jgi:hypothetical protein
MSEKEHHELAEDSSRKLPTEERKGERFRSDVGGVKAEEANSPISRELDRTLNNRRWVLLIASMILMVLIIIFAQFQCMLQFVCWSTDGSEISAVVSVTIIPLAAFNVFVAYVTYKTVYYTFEKVLQLWKWLMLIYGIILICVGVIILVSGVQINESDKEEVYENLTPYEKEFFENQIDDMVDVYKINMSLSGIFILVIGAYFVVIFFLLLLYTEKIKDITTTWTPSYSKKLPQLLNPVRMKDLTPLESEFIAEDDRLKNSNEVQ